MKVSAYRKLHICAGHRVMGHEGKCINPHGHNYIIWVHARADSLDSIGRVVDFSVLKEKVGGWIDKNWDHTFILCKDDIELYNDIKKHHKKDIFIMKENPTAENMALFLLNDVCPMLMEGSGITVHKIVVEETENCKAHAEL